MKTPIRNLTLAAALAAGCLVPRLSPAQTLWNAASGNWSTAANWNPNVVPTGATNVMFTNNVGAATSAGTVDNTVDIGFAGTIASLQFADTNSAGVAGGFYHTTQIGSGQTLTVLSNLTVNTFTDEGKGCQVYAGFTGAGTLLVSNATANVIVSQGGATAGESATLNLTNLNTFNAYIGGIAVGLYNTPDATLARELGNLYLAKTNNLNFIGNGARAYGNEGQIAMGENLGNGGSGSTIYLGIANTINVNTISIVGDKQSGGLLAFNPVFTNAYSPYAIFEGTNGPGSLVSSWIMADNSGQTTTGSGCSGIIDFSGGVLAAWVNTMTIGKGESGAASGTGSGTGVFTFNAGTNDVNTLYLGYRGATGGSSVGNGTMNVNGTGTLVVNNAICLSYWNGGSTLSGLGVLNINGGTVLAGTITNGINVTMANNNASVNMVGGTLGITSISGVAGTLLSPLETFGISGSTLQLDVSGVQTNIEAVNFNPAGTTNLVSFTYLPPVVSYPTTNALIGFQSQNGTLNLGISNFPAASPAYQGYITSDANTVYVVLTAGPTIGSSLDVWTGAHGSNWDTSTLNWSAFGSPVTFANGTPVQFDDTATGPTSINLTASLLPASLTANNSALAYSLGGTGKISGGASLTKSGSGSLVIANSGNNDFVGAVTVNAGTLQFGNGGTGGNLPASVSVTDNGSLVFDHSDSLTVPNVISGTGTLTMAAPSVLTLTASNEFDGLTIVSSGTLLVDGSLNGTLTNTATGVIGGSGTNFGTAMVSGLLQPSAASGGVPATFTVGNLTALPGGTLAFDLSGTDNTVGNGVNDLLQAGNLTLNNNVISLNFLGVPQTGVPYTVIYYSGSLGGGFSSVVGGTHYGAAVDTSNSGSVNVTLSGVGANLKWNSTTNAAWTIGVTSNWLNLASSLPDVFYAGDNVLLDDSVPGVITNLTLASGVSVSPLSLTNNSTADNYSIGGAGHLAGAGTIVKQGTSTLSLNTANNNFSGSVLVQGGNLRMGNNAAFGSGTVGISSGATLDLSGNSANAVVITAAGTGVGGNGAVVNSGADQIHAVQNLALAGDTTIGGPGRWDVRYNGATTATLNSADGSPCNLTKVGNNLVALVECGIDPSLGNVDIQGGTLGLQLTTLSLSGGWAGDSTHSITVESGAELELDSTAATPLGRNLVFNNGSTFENDGSISDVNGPVTLNGSVTNDITTALEMDSTITGAGGMTLVGNSILTLTGSSIYTGSTLINAGTLALTGSGSIASTNIVIAAGQKLDVSGRSDTTLTLASGQTLQGSGSVNGFLTVGAGATVSPGVNLNTIGILTVSNDVSLGGTTLMKLNAGTGTNDVLVTGGALTFGGTLTVANLAGSFTAGQTFQLFASATAPTGAFSVVNLPALGAGLGWTNNLAVNGQLGVISVGPLPQPHITGVSLSGTSLVISGTNGSAGQSFTVLGTTNLALPLSQWTVVGTNSFGGGSFSVTNLVNPGAPQNFYILRVP